MNFLKKIIRQHALKRAAKKNTRKKILKNLEDIKTAGIIFERNSDQTAANMQKLARFLHEQNIKVDVLAYVDMKKPTAELTQKTGLTLFYKKDLNWYGKPKQEKIHQFMQQPFDLLIKADFSMAFPLQYICAASKAALVAGPADNNHNLYDFFIENKKEIQNEYHQQLIHYLSVINQKSTQKKPDYV